MDTDETQMKEYLGSRALRHREQLRRAEPFTVEQLARSGGFQPPGGFGNRPSLDWIAVQRRSSCPSLSVLICGLRSI
jgi:hypothetical protein